VVTLGIGLAVIVNVLMGPLQALATGVILTVLIIAAFPVFTIVNDGILPVPVAANPMLVMVLLQL
jgi:hypothetical protein